MCQRKGYDILPKFPPRLEEWLPGNPTRKEVPEEVWGFALRRFLDTAGRVYLSPLKNVAMGECLSGLQDEYDLKSSVIMHKENLSEEKRPGWEEVLGKRLCKVCEVEVPVEEIYYEHKTFGWEQMKQEME